MKMQKRRSLATSVRLSLLAGAGALGWIAFGASGASAAEVPSDAGLLGSVTGAVESSSPVSSTLFAIVDPLSTTKAEGLPAAGTTSSLSGTVPLVSDLAAQVPHLTSQPTGTILTPVTSLVDEVVAEVPIVESVIPAGTVTEVTTPVVDAVDGTVGGVAEPVLEVVAPVVGIIDPVVDVVVPVPGIDAAIPVVPLPSPVAEVLPDVPSADVPGDSGPEAASPAAAADPTAADRTPGGSAIAAPSEGLMPDAGEGVAARSSGTGFAVHAFVTIADASVDVVVPAVVAGVARMAHDLPELPAAPLASWAGTLSSMTGAGTGGPFAAIGGAALLVFLALVRAGLRGASAGLPAGPTFDPGSSPD